MSARSLVACCLVSFASGFAGSALAQAAFARSPGDELASERVYREQCERAAVVAENARLRRQLAREQTTRTECAADVDARDRIPPTRLPTAEK